MANIASICSGLIKKIDNYEYHRALYDKFIVIMIKSNDYTNGYINATKLCEDGDKNLDNWPNKELINVINKELIDNVISSVYTCTNIDNNISGVYYHPYLIVHLLSWLSNDFALKVSKIFNNFFTNNQSSSFNNTLCLFKISDREYYITTVSDRNYDKRVENLHKIFNKAQLILKLVDIPNAKYLYDNIKYYLLDNNLGIIKKNIVVLYLNNYTEDMLILSINEINERINY